MTNGGVHTSTRFPEPVRGADRPGARGGRRCTRPRPVQRGPARLRGGPLLVPGRRCTAPEPILPVRRRHARLTPLVGFNQASARLFVVPPSLGLDHRDPERLRLHQPNSVTDEATSRRRAELFAKRGGYYYEHWDELYAAGWTKVEATIRELEALEVPELPELEDEAVVTEGRGVGSSYHAARRLRPPARGPRPRLAVPLRAPQPRLRRLHRLLRVLPAGVPGHHRPDDREDGRRHRRPRAAPDDELKRLARLAIELGVADAVKRGDGEDELRAARCATATAGARWLADFEEAKDPWFCFSTGTALLPPPPLLDRRPDAADRDDRLLHRAARRPARTSTARSRRCSPSATASPPSTASCCPRRARAGVRREPRARPHGLPLRREPQLLHRALAPLDVLEQGARARRAARTARLPGRRRGHLLPAPRRGARGARGASAHWARAAPGPPAAPRYWPPIVERRKRDLRGAARVGAAAGAGPAPDAITEPVTIMLWGITDRARPGVALDVRRRRRGGTLSGFAASPGVAEGRARVIRAVDQLDEVEQGEILVARSPPRAGRRCSPRSRRGLGRRRDHVPRRDRLPRVRPARRRRHRLGTKQIETGERVRVDGNTGVVDDPR